MASLLMPASESGCPRARTDDQLCRLLVYELLERHLIIAVYCDGRPLEQEVLVDIPCERVVIVDEYEVVGSRQTGSSNRLVGRVVDERRGRHLLQQ